MDRIGAFWDAGDMAKKAITEMCLHGYVDELQEFVSDCIYFRALMLAHHYPEPLIES